eukprot:2433698-Lingulodinium_polyedra.AAC.1
MSKLASLLLISRWGSSLGVTMLAIVAPMCLLLEVLNWPVPTCHPPGLRFARGHCLVCAGSFAQHRRVV